MIYYFVSIGEIYMKISWISMKYQDQTYAITTIIRIQPCKINAIYGKNEHQAIKKLTQIHKSETWVSFKFWI